MSYWIRLAGITPATEVAPHSAPSWETLADGGNGPAEFELGQSAKHQSHLTAEGNLVEIFCGCKRVWMGRIDDYSRVDGAVKCRGIHTDAYSIPALDGGGAVTRQSNVALATAVGAPWLWALRDPTDVAGGMGVASGDSTSPQMIGSLFDEVAAQNGKRWGQDADANLFYRSDPTTPVWLLAPDSAAFGQTQEGQASHLVITYQTTGGTNATQVEANPAATVTRAEMVDVTDRGAMTSGEVTALAAGAFAVGKSTASWVNGIEVTADQITTGGGTPAFLPSVTAGEMVRVLGLSAVHAGVQAPWLDVVIGKTRYTAGAKTIYLEPVNTAPRTFADVISAA